MTTEQKIITYLQQQSHGVINIPVSTARAIINIVTIKGRVATAAAVLYRINAQNNALELIRTIPTTDEANPNIF